MTGQPLVARVVEPDARPVIEGGQVVTVWHHQPPDAVGVYLDQLIGLDGESAVILSREPIRNGSGRLVGELVTVTRDAAEVIRDAIAADAEASRG